MKIASLQSNAEKRNAPYAQEAHAINEEIF